MNTLIHTIATPGSNDLWYQGNGITHDPWIDERGDGYKDYAYWGDRLPMADVVPKGGGQQYDCGRNYNL